MPRLPKIPTPMGASRKRQKTNPPERADELADFVLQDHRGEEVRLGDLWSDGPAVLVWLRHYG
jgi:prostamide/prostaglandin F2alpha synthase